ncbi:MAG TPA: hypothetical protein VNT79_04760 [Phycisphaerae bacterium]|nr:hypothetical protein [Phycisphaerae bacterium]
MTRKPVIIAHHLILTGYGHWLANDPRGSGSMEVYIPHLAELGEVHAGRKKIQPQRSVVRESYQKAEHRLKHELLWFNDAKRQAIGESFSRIIPTQRYTVYACAILRNHAHLCVRRHRDDAVAIWHQFADESCASLRDQRLIPNEHPLWSARPSKVFLHTPDDIYRIVRYINNNPMKEKLPAQTWNFVSDYTGWPHVRSNLAKK